MLEPSTDGAPDQSLSLPAILGPVLLLPKLAVQQLFALPGDALPQAVTRLTGLRQDDMMRLTNLHDPADYDHALQHEPAAFYYYVLVGVLAYDSPLGEAIRARVPGREGLLLRVMEVLSEIILPLLAEQVPTPTAEVSEALRALFAQEKYGLEACLPALVSQPEPAPAEAPTPAEEWLTMQPNPNECHLFSFALYLTHAALYGVKHPLAEALPTVAGLGTPAELVALAQRFRNAAPATEFALDGSDVIRLYLSLQVLALLFVADLQLTLMARLNPVPDDLTAPWLDPDQQHNMLHWVCTQVEAFGLLFDDYFGEEPAYQAAKADARRLAALV
ncbi:hypothetical protein [Hymenobacter terrenus]|uniref:hypothetical protein n=1 Tax=Hymenobacter terrenus TaxID=1629124 RepID=UPI000619226D|nr:hypothetical protein [Hymenobacter terrenus]